jgi:hypothetical protein
MGCVFVCAGIASDRPAPPSGLANCLVARHLETNGIPKVIVGSALDVASIAVFQGSISRTFRLAIPAVIRGSLNPVEFSYESQNLGKTLAPEKA